MRIEEAIEYIYALAAGCDPLTGETLDDGELVVREDVAKALELVSESLGVIKSALTGEEDQKKNELKGVYQLAYIMFNIKADGGPKRFSSDDWFHVGSSSEGCPKCNNSLEVFRKPYKTKADVEYHYWAVLCKECEKFMQPKQADIKTKDLPSSADLLPSKAPNKQKQADA